MGVTFALPLLNQVMGGIPGLTFNPMMLLHGEQYVPSLSTLFTLTSMTCVPYGDFGHLFNMIRYLEVRNPIPTSGSLRTNGHVKGLYDKVDLLYFSFFNKFFLFLL